MEEDDGVVVGLELERAARTRAVVPFALMAVEVEAEVLDDEESAMAAGLDRSLTL